jgi:hypothetical protein
VIQPADFVAGVDHPYFPLVPGTTYRYEEKSGKRVTVDEVTVTRDTKAVMGVTCVVVHDVARANGRVVEDTYDWYAQDRRGNVWYFGEDTKELRADGRADTEGSWCAGVDGAMPGVIMPASPTPGAPFREEYRRGTAEDMGQILAVADSVNVPAGSYAGCVRVKEWSPLERGSETKWYAQGVGFVRSQSTGGEQSALVEITHP